MTAKEAYQVFLQSDFWKAIRVECFRRDGWMCLHCGVGSKGRLQAHHKTYPVDWYDTTLDHLITLCRSCHSVEHGGKPQSKPVRKKARKAAMKKEKLPPTKDNAERVDRFIKDKKTLHQARARRWISRSEFKRRKAVMEHNAKHAQPRTEESC